MGFDIRMPIGMLFTLFGILLIGYGAATRGSAMYAEHSLGLNMNLRWGVALLAFWLVTDPGGSATWIKVNVLFNLRDAAEAIITFVKGVFNG